MAGLNFLIDIAHKTSGQAKALSGLKAMESGLKQASNKVKNLEAAQKRMRTKNGELGESYLRVSAALNRARADLGKASVAYADASGKLDQVGNAAGGARGRLAAMGAGAKQALMTMAGNLAAAAVQKLLAIGAAAGAALVNALKFSENIRFSLTRFLGTAGEAESAINGIMAQANKLGLSFQAAASQFKEMVSAGFSREAATELIAFRADLEALATDDRARANLTNAFDQIKKAMAAGRFEADGFYSVLENTPVTKMQVLKALAESTGKSVEELSKTDITKLPVKETIDAIQKAMLTSQNAANLGDIALKKQMSTMSGMANLVKTRVGNAFDALAAKMGPKLLEKAGPALKGLLVVFEGPAFSSAIDMVADGLVTAFEMAGEAAKVIKPMVVGLFEGLKSSVGPVLPRMIEFGKTILSWVTSAPVLAGIETAFKMIGFALGIVIDGLLAMAAVWTTVTATVASAIATVIGLGDGLVSKFLSLGGALIEGLVNGIQAGASAVVSAVSGVVGGAISSAKSLLGIASPSKVFSTIGNQTAEGFAMGVEGGTGNVEAKMATMVASPAITTPSASTAIANSTTTNNRSVNVTTGAIAIHGVPDAASVAPGLAGQLGAMLEAQLASAGAA